jgi:hypothetical protein
MCEVPKRSWREALRPVRVMLGLAALTSVITGARVDNAEGIVLIGLGLALLLAAVVLPVVREVEFGFPSGVKIVTAIHDREEELRQVFVTQKGDLELCSLLLCDDPAVAARLLEAAWAKATAAWRGPITPDIRIYVLCEFIHLLTAHVRWAQARPQPTTTPIESPLAALTLSERVAVVLREFAGVTLSEIARLTGRSPQQVDTDLRRAEAILARSNASGGAS